MVARRIVQVRRRGGHLFLRQSLHCPTLQRGIMASSSLFTQSFYSIMTTGMRSVSFWSLAAVVLILSGCAGSGQTAHPLAGNWDYVVETPDGNYEGTFMFTDGEEGLMGSIIGDGFSEALFLWRALRLRNPCSISSSTRPISVECRSASRWTATRFPEP